MSEVNRKTEDKLLEAIYGYAGEQYVESISAELIAGEPIPEPANKRIIRSIRREAFKQKVRRHSRWYSSIASVLVIALIGFSVATVGVEANRDKLFTVVKQVTKQFTSFKTRESNSGIENFQIPEDWRGIDVPSYVPSGYKVAEATGAGRIKIMKFRNSSGGEILFVQSLSGTIQFDTENALTEITDVNGLEAEYVEKDGQKSLAWHMSERMYFLSFNSGNKSDLFRMAESMERKK
jgi:hypothetical protein